MDNDPDLERGGWEILRVRDYKDLLHFLSFSLTSGAIGFERTRYDKVWWGTWGQFRDAWLWKTTAGARNQTAGMFIIVQEPGLLGRREKWRLGPLSPYFDPGLKGRKTDGDHEHKALLLRRVQGLTRYSLARGRKEVIDSYIGRAVHGKKKKKKKVKTCTQCPVKNKPPFHRLPSFPSQWETLLSNSFSFQQYSVHLLTYAYTQGVYCIKFCMLVSCIFHLTLYLRKLPFFSKST